MGFDLTIETSLATSQTTAIFQLSDKLSDYIREIDYGEQVREILVGIVTARTELDKFFKVCKQKYIDYKVIKDDIGNPVEISKDLSWDVKLDYESIKNLEGAALQYAVEHTLLLTLLKT